MSDPNAPAPPPTDIPGARPVLVVMSDLMFRSRIDDVARRIGLPLRVVRSLEQLDRHLGAGPVSLAIVDLEEQAFDSADVIRRLRDDPRAGEPRIVGFAGHTNQAAIRSGREAGADQVLARSAMTTHLAGLLQAAAERERARGE